jgi:S1-C subfamily serine protease
MPRVGVQITGVLSQSAANRAGLEIGDVVTRFGAFEQPSMRQIGQAYASADGSLIVTVTRGDRHLLLAIEKWR